MRATNSHTTDGGYGTIDVSAQVPTSNPSDTDCESISDSAAHETRSLLKGESEYPTLTFWQICVTILTLSGVSFASNFSTGLLTVGLPVIAEDLQLPEHLLLWPSSSYFLTCGCLLLLAGSIADKVGDRRINLLGTTIHTICMLANGLVANGGQLIATRTFQGLAGSMCLPTSVSIITRSIPPGRTRNFAFSCLGLVQPVGFSFGLVMEGAFEDAGNWRIGYYTCAGLMAIFLVSGIVYLPQTPHDDRIVTFRSFVNDIDWVGVLISSTGLGLLSYVCSIMSKDISLLSELENTSALVLSLLLLAYFPFWMQRQERQGNPALIPNSIWKNRAFVYISLTVFFAWASVQSLDVYMSLFFQKVQQVSPFDASLRLLPSVITGLILNPLTGLFVQHFKFHRLLVSLSILAAVAPLIMVFIDPDWSWWVAAFWAVVIGGISVDVLFTVAHMVITDAFPSNMHALAGAVFNTLAQLSSSLGMSTVAVISNTITNSSGFEDKESPKALMLGYRGAYAACFVFVVLSGATSFGLRCMPDVGKNTPGVRDGDEEEGGA